MKFKKVANINDRANGICSIHDLCSKTSSFRNRSTNNNRRKMLYRHNAYPFWISDHIRVRFWRDFADYDRHVKYQAYDYRVFLFKDIKGGK